jgi:hypothetical protein
MADTLPGDRVAAPEHSSAAGRCWELVIPRQVVVVRLNGRAPDASPLDYLPALRPYGVLAMARALHEEVPDLGRVASVRIAVRAHRGERAVAAAGTRELLDHIRARLRAYHELVSAIEPS